MNIETKARLYFFGIFFVIYIVIWTILNFIFKELSSPILGAITAFITVLLSPQKQVIKTQSGEYIQLKWLFSKKVINIKQ